MAGADHCFGVEFPVAPLFETSQGPVMELVFWSELVKRWIHAVSQHFAQGLPEGHVQVALGDMQWVRYHAQQGGQDGLAWVVRELEVYQRGIHAPPV